MAFDISELQGLLSQFGPTEEEKRKAKFDALTQFGLGLLGTQKGQEWDRVGRSGAYAMQSQGDALHNITQQKMQGMQAAGQAMGLKEQMQKFADADELRKQQQAFAGQFGGPTGQPTPSSFGMNDRSAGDAPAAPAGAPQGAPAPGGVPDKRAVAQQYQKYGDWWMSQGRPEKAQQYYDLAQKAIPQIKETKTLTQGGKRVVVNFYTDGTHEILPDVGPDAEKAHFLDTGKTVGAVDPFTGQPITGGGMYNKQMTPGEDAADARAKAAQAQAERHFQAGQAKENKPQWDASSGQFVYPPSANAPTGRAITPDGFTKPDKPLSESQAKATAFVNQMQNASKTLADLEKQGFSGKGAGQQAAIVGAGSEGIPFVPGSASIPRMLSGSKAQQFQQAEMVWTEAALRFMTGANAPEQEVRRNAETYFPRPGDDAAKIAQKAAARATMEQSIRMAAGAGDKKLDKPTASAGISQDAVEAEMRRRGLK